MRVEILENLETDLKNYCFFKSNYLAGNLIFYYCAHQCDRVNYKTLDFRVLYNN